MRTGQAFLIVYSITDEQSFQEALQIYDFTLRMKGVDKIPAVSITLMPYYAYRTGVKQCGRGHYTTEVMSYCMIWKKDP